MTTVAATAGLAGCAAPATPAAARASDVSLAYVGAPRAKLPAGSCDCHVHLFEPARFPYIPQRSYTPGTATVEDLRAFEGRLGVDRVVLVQPSGYGTDNRCLVDGLGQLARSGGLRARGVAVIDVDRATPADIDALHAAGVRSIRLNLEVKGEQSADRARAQLQGALRKVAHKRWSVQIYADLHLVHALADTIAQTQTAAPTPVVLDHFAGLKADRGLDQPGLATVLELLGKGHVYAKLSAPYRASRLADYSDLQPFVRAFVSAAPTQLVWASDWPHTGSASNRSGDLSKVEAFRRIDSGQVLDQLAGWIAHPATWRQLMVDNPARLYDFA